MNKPRTFTDKTWLQQAMSDLNEIAPIVNRYFKQLEIDNLTAALNRVDGLKNTKIMLTITIQDI